MSRPVTLVAWEDATKKPPAQQGMDDGLLPLLIEDEDTTFPAWWNNRDWIDWDCSGDHDHKPVRWTEFPTPPGPDALTVDDLRLIHDYLGADEEDFPANLYDAIILAQTRLRRALAALATVPTPPEEDA